VEPFSVALFKEKSGSLRDDEHFDRPTYQRCAIARRDDLMEIVVWGQVFAFKRAADAVLRFVFSHHSFSMRELLDRAGSLSRDDVAGVLDVLLEHGIVTRRSS
jgi:hypothetical protein